MTATPTKLAVEWATFLNGATEAELAELGYMEPDMGKQWKLGYDEALSDILAKYLTDGPEGALQWIIDNTSDATVRAGATTELRSLDTSAWCDPA
jgi:hypothetical protein